jgi:hypothetical protein
MQMHLKPHRGEIEMTTAAQRYNERVDRIFEKCLEAKSRVVVEDVVETVSLSELESQYSQPVTPVAVPRLRTRDSRLGAVESDGRKKTAVSWSISTVDVALAMFPGVSITKAMQLFVDHLVSRYTS